MPGLLPPISLDPTQQGTSCFGDSKAYMFHIELVTFAYREAPSLELMFHIELMFHVALETPSTVVAYRAGHFCNSCDAAPDLLDSPAQWSRNSLPVVEITVVDAPNWFDLDARAREEPIGEVFFADPTNTEHSY